MHIYKYQRFPMGLLAWALSSFAWAQISGYDASKEINTSPPLPAIPLELEDIQDMQRPYAITDGNGKAHISTIDPRLQRHLELFIRNRGNPISASIVIEVATGNILALVQGRPPQRWNSSYHTALYPHFPAASLFKTVVAAAALEMGGWQPEDSMVLWGGCGDVRRNGIWIRDDRPTKRNQISLRTAFGRSCNGIFAKLAVNHVGLSIINHYAQQMGWGDKDPLSLDFALAPSPISSPSAKTASIHAVGRYAAGFGDVGTSAAHAAWIMVALARDGAAQRLRIFEHSPDQHPDTIKQIVNPQTAQALRQLMKATTNGGTASYVFRKHKYRHLRLDMGGKTGTLTGKNPKALTTWFAGMMPMDNPQIVVASVVVLDGDLWHIKGPDLAAESVWAYDELYKTKGRLLRQYGPHPKEALSMDSQPSFEP